MRASFKGAISSRQTFWKRLRELLALSDLPETQWQEGWVALAQKQGGVVWTALIRKWVRWQESWLSRIPGMLDTPTLRVEVVSKLLTIGPFKS